VDTGGVDKDDLLMLAGFAAWLRRYGSLVRSITLRGLASSVK
jgi:hypothetical protein